MFEIGDCSMIFKPFSPPLSNQQKRDKKNRILKNRAPPPGGPAERKKKLRSPHLQDWYADLAIFFFAPRGGAPSGGAPRSNCGPLHMFLYLLFFFFSLLLFSSLFSSSFLSLFLSSFPSSFLFLFLFPPFSFSLPSPARCCPDDTGN